MANSNNVSVTISLVDAISDKLKSINQKVTEFTDKTSNSNLQPLNEGFAKVRREIIGIASAFEALNKGEDRFFAEQRLLAVLQGRVEIQQQLIKQADILASQSIFPAVEFIKGAALIKAIGVSAGELPRAMQIAADSATSLGVSIGFISKQIAQARVGGFADRFGRLIPEFRELRLEGNLVNQVFDVLEQRFAGTAARMTEVSFGARKVQLNKIQAGVEKLGKVISEVTLPSLTALATGLESFANFVSSQNNAGVRTLAADLTKLALSVSAMVIASRLLILVLNPMNLALAGVALALLTLYQNAESIPDTFLGVGASIKSAIVQLKKFGGGAIELFNNLKKLGEVDKTISPILSTVGIVFKNLFLIVGNQLGKLTRYMFTEVQNFAAKVQNFFAKFFIIGSLMFENWIKGLVNKAIEAINSGLERAKDVLNYFGLDLGPVKIQTLLEVPTSDLDRIKKQFDLNLERTIKKNNADFSEYAKYVDDTTEKLINFSGALTDAIGVDREVIANTKLSIRDIYDGIKKIHDLKEDISVFDTRAQLASENLASELLRLKTVTGDIKSILDAKALENLVSADGFKDNQQLKAFAKRQADVLLEQRVIGLEKYLEIVKTINTAAFKVELDIAEKNTAIAQKSYEEAKKNLSNLEDQFQNISPNFEGVANLLLKNLQDKIDSQGITLDEAIRSNPADFEKAALILGTSVKGVQEILTKYRTAILDTSDAENVLSQAIESQTKAALDYKQGLDDSLTSGRAVIQGLVSDANTLKSSTRDILGGLKAELDTNKISRGDFLVKETEAIAAFKQGLIEIREQLILIGNTNPELAVAAQDAASKINDALAKGASVENSSKQLKDMKTAIAEVGLEAVNTFGNQLADALTTGSKNFKQFAGEFLAAIGKMIVKMLVFQALQSIFGFTSGSGVGGALGFPATASNQPLVLGLGSGTPASFAATSNTTLGTNISSPSPVRYSSSQPVAQTSDNSSGSSSGSSEPLRAYIKGGDDDVERFLASGADGFFNFLSRNSKRLHGLT